MLAPAGANQAAPRTTAEQANPAPAEQDSVLLSAEANGTQQESDSSNPLLQGLASWGAPESESSSPQPPEDPADKQAATSKNPTVTRVCRAAGGMAGGRAGGAAGAAIGSFAGPVGTVIGFAAGSILGRIAGRRVGEAVCDRENQERPRSRMDGNHLPHFSFRG